jgi:hypothetical protein
VGNWQSQLDPAVLRLLQPYAKRALQRWGYTERPCRAEDLGVPRIGQVPLASRHDRYTGSVASRG